MNNTASIVLHEDTNKYEMMIQIWKTTSCFGTNGRRPQSWATIAKTPSTFDRYRPSTQKMGQDCNAAFC